jgi:adenosylcobyric acid synthase
VSASLVNPEWFNAVKSNATCRWNQVKGYEIHMGNTSGDVGLFKLKRLDGKDGSNGTGGVMDGSVKGNVWGTYIHGIFDNDGIRTGMLNAMRKSKGLPEQDAVMYKAIREEAINRWAKVVGESVDICFILRQVDMEMCMKKLPEDLK